MSSPNHYIQGNKEIIEIINDILSDKAFNGYEGFLIGNVIKYVARYKHKDGVKDLEKARVYLNWLIEITKNSASDKSEEKTTEEAK